MEFATIFSPAEIKQQTLRILNFPSFRNSPVLSRFLEFVITETLDEKELQIKEYSVAIHVLGRSRDFNPNRDSIVRIHAGRLRRALTDYYLSEGMYDPIIIQIPKGCYVPEFIASGTTTLDAPPESLSKVPKPRVAIFPLKIITHKEQTHDLQTLLEGHLSEELLRFHDITVVGYYSMDMKEKINENVLEAGKAAGADYIITGSLTSVGQSVRVLLKFLVTASGEVLQCKFFDSDILIPALIDIRDDIFQKFIDFANCCYRSIIDEKQKLAYIGA